MKLILKNIRIKLVLLTTVALILAFSACNKLNIKPTDTIDPSKAFRNLEDVDMGVLGAYAILDYTLISNCVTVSDEGMVPTENTVGNQDSYRWLYTASSGSVTSAFVEYYKVIDRANRVLTAIEDLEVSSSEQSLMDRYKGELLAIRAFSHLELLRAYASSYDANAMGVPYMKVSEIGYPSRDAFEVVMNNIKEDLVFAKSLIPESFSDKSRITKTAVSAIQARTALYNKEWPDAIKFAGEVINAIPLATRGDFPGIWTDDIKSEVVWELRRTSTSDSRIGAFFYRENGGYVLFAPAFKLMNTYDKANDIRYSSYVLYNPGRGAGKSEYLVNKYIGGASITPGLTDIKLFRTAEMYLIRAEAYAETEKVGDGQNDLNALRRARISGYTDQNFAGKAALIESIYSERYKELAFEGHRFFDLKRRNLPVERLQEDAVMALGAVKLDSDKAQYAFPIPVDEMKVNKNMKQNPKYSAN